MAIEFRPSSAPKRKELPVEDRSGPQCPSPSLPDTSAGNPHVQAFDNNLIIGVDPGSNDSGSMVICKVMDDGKLQMIDMPHSKGQFDRLKYQREYMRDRNTIKRLGLNMTVGEWRKSKGLPS